MLPIPMPCFVVIELDLWRFEAAIVGNWQTDRQTDRHDEYHNPAHAQGLMTGHFSVECVEMTGVRGLPRVLHTQKFQFVHAFTV